MNDKREILLAFFIPLFLAIGLLLLRIDVFYDPYDPWIANAKDGFIATPYEDYEISKQLQIIQLLIVGLIVLSLTLPPFVMMRKYQSRRKNFGTASIIE